ncbi:DUF1553 domain-containing protein [Lacipirellula limnantheis]|uniref:Planctomycete cytochrome C n=1 Tax=Lacipirellula limnantheis TaxID=2528024 RepID=A0A517TXW4_9BACT|nr:DUF1553 domain-containing protein [Lacipirellula limnantheis]QDT73191.1 Planctomycete cytochrome C [Lacipirellula limnantheis]
MKVLDAALLVLLTHAAAGAEVVDFNREVRPILSENCFHCHGADAAQRQGELRLDVPAHAYASGAIVPGMPAASNLVQRIQSIDPNDQMPPPDSHRALTPQQIETLIQWIQEGAAYDVHWAFKSIKRPALPAQEGDDWGRSAIDRFVADQLNANDLTPSQRAPLPTLLRRLSLDLTGLPASAEQLTRWQAATDPAAAAVDELLASPHYGERMATEWLDVARYADTHGFNNDAARTMWPWRDWVVKAFNDNMPYDQFIAEQLAGDLLPHASQSQRLATGFNRNHVINSEGGIIDEEYRVEYVADRVRTTSMAWLGLTLECARCHDHKFDPISQRDYYQFFAFFNNIDETGEDGRIANAAPLMPAPSSADQGRLRALKRQESQQRKKLRRLIMASSSEPLATAPAEGRADASPPQLAVDLFSESQGFPDDGFEITPAKPLSTNEGWSLSAWINRKGAEAPVPLMSTMNYATPRSAGGYGAGAEVGFTSAGAVDVRLAVRWPAYATHVVSRRELSVNEWSHVAVIVTGNKARDVRIFVDGIESATMIRRDGLTGDVVINEPIRVGHTNRNTDDRFAGELRLLQLSAGPVDAALFESAIQDEIVRDATVASAALRQSNRTRRFLANALRRAASDVKIEDAWNAWRTTHAQRLELERSFPQVMVMQEMPEPRRTHVLLRGQYDVHGELVTADVPRSLGLPLPEDAPRNRLTLARWLTDPRHPLTARVVMNRLWQQLFGVGLVKTASDFGVQSEWPSHPELLDFLAAEFIENGWDLKHMVRLIVGSATYQQDSAATAEMWQRDPENRLLARGPRQRLTAEMVRDQALAVSGLLNPAVGGPPAYPYQPPDYYMGIVVAADYPGSRYTVGSGGDLYRRSMYTFWKRTVPHPTLATFDSPDREFCVARRSPTNTPLQALALMNDPTFLEAARKLGERMMNEGGTDDATRLAWGFRIVTARQPSPEELLTLVDLLARQRRDFADGASITDAVLAVGDAARSQGANDVELAAYASLASLLLNLDEAINRN